MRRQAPINNHSSSRSRRSPLLLGALALLLFAIYRVYSIHGDLQELHQTLNQQQNAVEASADVLQVGQIDSSSNSGCGCKASMVTASGFWLLHSSRRFGSSRVTTINFWASTAFWLESAKTACEMHRWAC